MKLLALVVVILMIGTGNCVEEKSHYKDGEHDSEYDHEAILGSEDDVEEFSHLSPEEAKEKLGKIFGKIDANVDGHVDNQELTKWILHSFHKLNVEDTESKMKTDDTDGDNMISWNEYLEATYDMTEEELKQHQNEKVKDPETEKMLKKVYGYEQKKFTIADANGDGKLNVEEATAFLHPYDYPSMMDVETQRVLEDFDANKDGKITADEYLANDQFSDREEEDLIGEKENFLYHDDNGDEILDSAEIKKWVAPDLEKLANEEATHLMTETDKNKDGQLSVEEVKQEHELWVGSEATDYGQLLERDEL